MFVLHVRQSSHQRSFSFFETAANDDRRISSLCFVCEWKNTGCFLFLITTSLTGMSDNEEKMAHFLLLFFVTQKQIPCFFEYLIDVHHSLNKSVKKIKLSFAEIYFNSKKAIIVLDSLLHLITFLYRA